MMADPALLPNPAVDVEERRIVVLGVILFAALSLFEAAASKGFLEADSCTHYMYARFAFANPHYFTNVWGRPVCTALYAGPAWLAGRFGARAASLCVAVGLALVAKAIARGQGWRWPALATAFTLAQPLVFLHSFSELTELPFALLLALAFWAYQGKRFWPMALVVGLTPLSRPEGFGFLVLGAITLLAHRRPVAILLLMLPLVAWDWAGWKLSGSQGPWTHWLSANWPYAEKSLYEPGPLLHFVMLLPAVTSPLIFPATVIGAVLCCRGDEIESDRSRTVTNLQSAILRIGSVSFIAFVAGHVSIGIASFKSVLKHSPAFAQTRGHAFFTDHRKRCELLIAIIPIGILAGHSLLYWRGKMASNGEVRYMLTVAVFWGLLAARGWGWMFERMQWRHTLQWAALAAAAPLIINLFYAVLPLRSQPDWVRAAQVADWYRSSDLRQKYPYLAAAHPGVFFELDLCPSDSQHTRDWRKSILGQVPPGTLLVYDGCYGFYNADPTRSITQDELVREGWTPLQTPFNGMVGKWPWQVYVSKPI